MCVFKVLLQHLGKGWCGLHHSELSVHGDFGDVVHCTMQYRGLRLTLLRQGEVSWVSASLGVIALVFLSCSWL
jgi:hypothetical protein